jgi:hypothetical protein
MELLRTGRLLLRRRADAGLAAFFDLCSREDVVRWLGAHPRRPLATAAQLKQYRHSSAVTDLEEFPDRGHSLTIDAGWAAVADLALAWLGKHGLYALLAGPAAERPGPGQPGQRGTPRSERKGTPWTR